MSLYQFFCLVFCAHCGLYSLRGSCQDVISLHVAEFVTLNVREPAKFAGTFYDLIINLECGQRNMCYSLGL
jgi:hypothetical protein